MGFSEYTKRAIVDAADRRNSRVAASLDFVTEVASVVQVVRKLEGVFSVLDAKDVT